jgi:hypothetical protein
MWSQFQIWTFTKGCDGNGDNGNTQIYLLHVEEDKHQNKIEVTWNKGL